MTRNLILLLLLIGTVLAATAQNGSAPPFARGNTDTRTETPTVPDGPVDPDTTMVSIAFVKADLVNVLGFMSMASGIPIIVDADVKGTVTISSMKKVPLSLAYEAVNAALRVRGYTMVGTLKDKLIRVVTLKKAVSDRAVVQQGNDPDKVGTGDAIVTQIIPVQYISAAKLKDELKPLVADDQANLLAISSTNTLIVTDTEGNIHRLLQIIKVLDTGDSTSAQTLEVYQCKFASATVLIDSLEKVLGIGNYATRTGAQPNPGQPQPGRPGGPPNTGGNQPAATRTDDGLIALKSELRLSADERTNAILISAAKERIPLVIDLIKKLDIDTTSDVKARIFRLQYADASLVATQLTNLFEQPQGSNTRTGFARFFGGGNMNAATAANDYAGLKRNTIVADVRTNSVVVTATEQNMNEFAALIKELDAPNLLSDIARPFRLKYAKATTLATTLNNLFRGNTSRTGNNFRDLFFGTSSSTTGDPIASLRNITVVADEKTNTLLITGPPQAFPMVQNLIDQLDRRTPQVFIQVAIVDVTLDDSNKFGVEWSWANDPHGTGTATRHEVGSAFGVDDEKFGLKYSVISSNLQALLHALKTKSNVKVYSTPSITTADNVAAKISIGQDVPFVTSSEETNNGNLRQTVDFKNVSITLNVTPHVTDATNLITLDVQQTINELIGRELELNAPTIANREAKSTVMVNDGQTIVIGGIIKENVDKQQSAVPYLSDIPLVGELFKKRTTTRTKSELMVFLTPHILRDEESVTAVTTQERNKLTDPIPDGMPVQNGTPAVNK